LEAESLRLGGPICLVSGEGLIAEDITVEEAVTIILSDVSQAQKTKNHMFSLICGLNIYGKYRNVVGLGSHAKGRAYTGGMEIGSKPKTRKRLMSPLQRN
jgi:hypothetical protein